MNTTDSEKQLDLILAAYERGREDGFREAWDVREAIQSWENAPDVDDAARGTFERAVSIASDVQDFAAADAVYLESTGLRVDDLEQRVRLIEQQYLGVDYKLGVQAYTAVPDEADECNCEFCLPEPTDGVATFLLGVFDLGE